MRRRVAMIVVFLIGGAAINVAVAWGFAIFVDVQAPSVWRRYGESRLSEPPSLWTVMSFDAPSARRVLSHWQQGGVSRFLLNPHDNPADKLVPDWAQGAAQAGLKADERIDAVTVIADARGWPMLSMWSAVRYEMDLVAVRINDTPGWKATVEMMHARAFPHHPLPDPNIAWPSNPILIPLALVWPGFAFNTLFYTAILWLLIRGPRMLRRFLRRRRGQCVACGYDLRAASGGRCPECGTASAPAPSPRGRGLG